MLHDDCWGSEDVEQGRIVITSQLEINRAIIINLNIHIKTLTN